MIDKAKAIRRKILIRKRYMSLKRKVEEQEIKHLGDKNPDRIIYLIQRRERVGLCSYVLTNIAYIKTALECGWLPVIDMQSYPNTYLEDSEVNQKNAWESFFKPVSNVTVEEALQSKRVIFSKPSHCLYRPFEGMEYYNNTNGQLTMWRKLFRKYINYDECVLSYMEQEYKRLIGQKDRILGVLCRGTDYVNTKPKDHPIQPAPLEVMDKAEEVLKECGCSKIFLATEDAGIMERFRERFQDIVVTNKRELYHDTGDALLSNIKNNRENDTYLKGLEYLTTIWILSQSSCYIGGRTSGSVVTMMMTEGFEYQYLWDVGYY